MTTFAVGERALVLAVRPDYCGAGLERYLGETVTVIGQLQAHDYAVGGFAYRVAADNGHSFYVVPARLQKLPPTRDDLQVVRWSDCPWQPAQVRA